MQNFCLVLLMLFADLTVPKFHFPKNMEKSPGYSTIRQMAWQLELGSMFYIYIYYFILNLWEFARLFAAMACVNLVFPLQKLNSNDTLQRDTKGFNAAFSNWISSVSVVQFTVQMSKLNRLGETHRERIFIVELNLKLHLLFHYEQTVWKMQILNKRKFHRLVQLQPNT